MTPPTGPWGVSLGLHRVGGYRGNEIFFYVRDFAHFGPPIQCQRILFLCRHFSAFWARQGAFPGWACPFPAVREEGPSQGFHMPLRACVRELSTMSRNTTSKTQLEKLVFFDGGEPIWAGKRKTTSHFFHPKIFPFLRLAAPTQRSLSGRTCRRPAPFSL